MDFLAVYDRFCVGLPWHNLWRNPWQNLLPTCVAISRATHGVNSIVTCGACPIRPSGSARPTRPSSSVACFPAPNRPPANLSRVSSFSSLPFAASVLPPFPYSFLLASLSLSPLSLLPSPSSSCSRGCANYTWQERKIYPQKGVRSKTKRAGIEGMGYTCWLTRERMKANRLKMIVVVVEYSFLENNYC